MKKFSLMVLLAGMVLGVTACAGPKAPTNAVEDLVEDVKVEEEIEEEPVKEEAPGVKGSLEEIMDQVYRGVDLELPGMAVQPVNADNMTFFLGVNDIKFDEAIASEPMMSSQAHSIVLLRLSEGEDVEKVKSKIKNNVDGRKWICVEVDEKDILTSNIGNLVILIMDDHSKDFQTSFLNLAK